MSDTLENLQRAAYTAGIQAVSTRPQRSEQDIRMWAIELAARQQLPAVPTVEMADAYVKFVLTGDPVKEPAP